VDCALSYMMIRDLFLEIYLADTLSARFVWIGYPKLKGILSVLHAR